MNEATSTLTRAGLRQASAPERIRPQAKIRPYALQSISAYLGRRPNLAVSFKLPDIGGRTLASRF